MARAFLLSTMVAGPDTRLCGLLDAADLGTRRFLRGLVLSVYRIGLGIHCLFRSRCTSVAGGHGGMATRCPTTGWGPAVLPVDLAFVLLVLGRRGARLLVPRFVLAADVLRSCGRLVGLVDRFRGCPLARLAILFPLLPRRLAFGIGLVVCPLLLMLRLGFYWMVR